MATLGFYTDFAKRFRKEIDDIMQACDCVYDLEQCENCPLKKNCLRDESIETLWSETSIEALADFYEYSDDVCNEGVMTEEDYEGRWADEQRGIDRDLAEM